MDVMKIASANGHSEHVNRGPPDHAAVPQEDLFNRERMPPLELDLSMHSQPDGGSKRGVPAAMA